MTQRVNFSILFCTISILTAQAQWNKQDSIRLQELLNGDGELKINTEAVKSIHFDFQSDKDNIKGTPIMSEDKPWMKFLKDLPKNFGDTTKWVRPNFVRLTPYTPYTTWHEDPVNDPIFLKRKDSLTISWKLNIKLIPGLQNGYIEYKNKTQEKCNYCTIYQCISGFYKKNVELHLLLILAIDSLIYSFYVTILLCKKAPVFD